MILSIDIGGTKVAIATYHVTDSGLKVGHSSRFHTAAAASLVHMIEQHFGGKVPAIRGVGIGVAGPVRGRQVRLTNVDWEIDADAISKAIGAPVYLLNDLAAHGYAVPHLAPDHLVTLQQGERGDGPAVLIAAGTGLGEAVLVWHGDEAASGSKTAASAAHRELQVLPSEGGHATFGPVTKADLNLAGFLQERYDGHVSWERVVSGQCGFRNLFDFLRQKGEPASPALLQSLGDRADIGADIITAASEGEPIAEKILNWFSHLYGAEAGNLALKVVATGGVYVGGGIAPRMLPYLMTGPFMSGFRDKGRFDHLLEQIPVQVITEPNVALLGAAHYTAAQVRKHK